MHNDKWAKWKKMSRMTEMWKCKEPDWSLTPMICRGKYNLHIGVRKLSDIINLNIYLFRYFQKQVLIFTDVKGFCIVAWLCSVYCQATFKLPRIWLTKGFKGLFVILHAHSRVWMGSMLYKAFCLVYQGSHPNNREPKYPWF